MIIYVDLEHEQLRTENQVLWEMHLARTTEIKYRVEALTGMPCLIVRYPRASVAFLREFNVRAVLVSGHHTLIHHYAAEELAGLRAMYLAAAWPTLAFCGGLQLLAQTYGAEIGPMTGPPDTAPAMLPTTPLPLDPVALQQDASIQDATQERGFLPVRVERPSPLLEGLGDSPVFLQLHSWEVKAAPDGFVLLASSPVCQVQMLAHQQALLVGTQFHPERYDEAHPAGQRLLLNFFKLAGVV